MANGTISLGKSKQTEGRIIWSATADLSTNASTVTVEVQVRRWDGNYTTTGTWTGSVSIGSSSASISHYAAVNGWVTVKTFTATVSHNSDGTGTCKISATVNGPTETTQGGAQVSGSDTVTLDTIARASVPTVSASSVVMLNKVTITTNRKSSSFTHDLTYSFGGSTGTIATGVGESYAWTVPDLVSKISGKTSGTCTITCKTKNGSTVVGSKTVSLTLTIPAKSTPSASASTVKMGTSVNIYTNWKSTGYRHTLTYAIGDTSGTIDTNVEGGRTWTPPKSLAAHTGNKTSATCTITCKTYTGSTLVGTATSEIILTVPDATVPKVSATSIVLGDSITIYTPREADCYEHDISYTLKAEGSSTVAFTKEFSGPVQESYEWTPSLTLLAPEIAGATKGTITITCTTRFKDSTTVVGTVKDAVSFTVTIPSDSTTQPKVTMSVSPVGDLPSAFSGLYLAGKSQVKVSYEASSDYSTIKSYLTKINNNSGSTNPYTSPLLAISGTVTITGKVTDARGYSTTKTKDIEVIPYSRPRVVPGEGKSSIICERCNSDGTADPGGVYLLIQIGRKYESVVSGGKQKNFCTLSYRHKNDADDDSGYSAPVELLAANASTNYVSVVLKNIVPSNTTAYTIQIIAEDNVGEKDTVTVTIPTAFVTAHAPEGGHGFTLGGYHDPSKYDVFDCRFSAEFNSDVSGRVLGLGALPEIPEDADANDYKGFGAYAVPKNATAKTITNLPSEKAGTLRVWSANGSGTITGNYVYIMQEYVCYDNSGTYRRSMQLPNPDSAWEYGDWTIVADYVEGVTGIWYWRKYSDGTAECWGRAKNASRDIATQFGSMYYGNCDEVTFPFSFYSAPVVTATVESGTALILMSWQGTDGNGTTTATKPASYRVVRPTSITGAAFTIAYHAIGRWKE